MSLNLRAHYDGHKIILDEPFDLEPNARLIITVIAEKKQDAESAGRTDLLFDDRQPVHGEAKFEYPADLTARARGGLC